MNQIVIDASVVLKWYLADEENGQKALRLLDKYVSDQIHMMAPMLLEYEVVNGLVVAMRKGRLEEKALFGALDGFANLNIQLRPLSPFYSKVLYNCMNHSISAYDASYLTLAEEEEALFVTADKRLFNSIRKNKWVKWLGDIETR